MDKPAIFLLELLSMFAAPLALSTEAEAVWFDDRSLAN